MNSQDLQVEFKNAVVNYNYSLDQEGSDAISSVEAFGRKWVASRGEFLKTGFNSLVSTIYQFVMSLIKSGFALIQGEGFKDSDLNERAIESWKDCGACAKYALGSALGVIAPSAVKFLVDNEEQINLVGEYVLEKIQTTVEDVLIDLKAKFNPEQQEEIPLEPQYDRD